MEDPYRVLGIPRTASQKEIKSAYRKLARTRHPDVSLRPKANQEFSIITEAYRILSDPNLRSRYDRGEVLRDEVAERLARARRENEHVRREVERFRQDVNTRAPAVVIVTTLFLSTFITAVAQPVLGLDSTGYIALSVLAVCGTFYMVVTLRSSFEKYTYRPRVPSIKEYEAPIQPYSRGAAVAFIIVGYGLSLALGSLVGDLIDISSLLNFDRGSITGIFLFPPIAVMIVDGMRRLNYRS
ncbi:MAG TPA: J domain-containing protein [Blastocatellia bacterium]|nr:J domain-containing protein [Blastocatellia bacterium]